MLINRYEEFLKNRRVYCVEKTVKYYADNVQRFISFCADNNIYEDSEECKECVHNDIAAG